MFYLISANLKEVFVSVSAETLVSPICIHIRIYDDSGVGLSVIRKENTPSYRYIGVADTFGLSFYFYVPS